jgi:hypothetical protein
LRSHGFAPDINEIRVESRAWVTVGLRLQHHHLPTTLPDAHSLEAYRSLAVVDPYLWAALPRVAGFGYRQAAVVDCLVRREAKAPDDDVLLVGAAFNVAIALLDYLVDDAGASDIVFGLVDDALVSALFSDSASSADILAERRRSAHDPRIHVLLALMSVCVTRARLLLRRSGNVDAWVRLAECVYRAYVAERLTAPKFPLCYAESLSTALEDKARLPVKIMMYVSFLASNPHENAIRPELEDRLDALGRLIGTIDDIVDVAKDSRAGVPSLALRRLGSPGPSDIQTISDADLYRLIRNVTQDVVTRMRAEGFTVESAAMGAASDDCELARFARAAVALWSDWDESSSMPIVGSPAERTRTCAVRATDLLLQEQRAGYPTAIHNFPMPSAKGQGEVTYPAVLYQRATILDGLIDAYEAGLDVPRSVLDAEALEILLAKHESMPGGWSYIPEMRLLPPDADDLGIVLQVLHRIGGADLAAACDEAVRLSLDAAEPTGAIPTWILGLADRSSPGAASIAYIDSIGSPGDGTQPEVVANLCYGLLVSDRRRYEHPLQRAIGYLETAQVPDGHWISSWYAGPYYGTYRALSVIATVRPTSKAVGPGQRFLLRRQRRDGGWGEQGSDPLNTAFAVLALALSGAASRESAVGRGVDYLLREQEADGGWPTVVWGRFPTPYGVQTYGSRPITTSFALKAVLAVSAEPHPPSQGAAS